MRIEEKKNFTPITITLETQDELDQLFALLNNEQISTAIECDKNDWNNVYQVLQRHASTAYDKWHIRIANEFFRIYGPPISGNK